MRRTYLFVISICLVNVRVNSQFRNACTTPNGENGRCISLRSCSILYNALHTSDQQQLAFLRDSRCGYRQEQMVCCGSYDNYRRNSNTPFGGGAFSWGENGFDNTNDRPVWGGLDNRRTNGGWEDSEETPQRNNANQNTGSSSTKLPDRSTCGFQATDRILDGQSTALTEFPWMALLQYRKKTGALTFSCGGTLISSRYVLTAAHCVRGQILTKIGPLVNVRLGEYNTETDRDCSNRLGFEMCNDKPVDSDIEKVITHPNYNDVNADRHHDIALIRLKKEMPTTNFIKPICLPGRSDKSAVGERLVVAGWGRTEYATSSPVKLKLWVPVAEGSQCSSKFRSAGVSVGGKQLCAGGERGRDSCQGDSGGPLMKTSKNDSAQWYIEGIVSFGAKCGSEGWPGIYTRVAEYVDWIQQNVN